MASCGVAFRVALPKSSRFSSRASRQNTGVLHVPLWPRSTMVEGVGFELVGGGCWANELHCASSVIRFFIDSVRVCGNQFKVRIHEGAFSHGDFRPKPKAVGPICGPSHPVALHVANRNFSSSPLQSSDSRGVCSLDTPIPFVPPIQASSASEGKRCKSLFDTFSCQ